MKVSFADRFFSGALFLASIPNFLPVEFFRIGVQVSCDGEKGKQQPADAQHRRPADQGRLAPAAHGQQNRTGYHQQCDDKESDKKHRIPLQITLYHNFLPIPGLTFCFLTSL